jgi:single-strand DNA-binding protein
VVSLPAGLHPPTGVGGTWALVVVRGVVGVWVVDGLGAALLGGVTTPRSLKEDQMNTVTLTGRLTQDPKVRTAGELEICDVRLAVPRRRGSDGSDRGAVFIDIVAFGGLAKTCGQYLAKGRRVNVVGRLELDEWQASDDTPRRKHKVIADQVEFLDPAPAKDADTGDEVAARREQREPVAA